ncbi:MAG: FemAB family PEP-CTERM system-associated protein [Planctomycetes bacterium]|nr:FemAB family PEP-CTERM system-associated protein [Planctomycetota bacterium]MCB9869502.1 FemAB family PEP-CTERM system-associated protein [Planctomycetota bacterium]
MTATEQVVQGSVLAEMVSVVVPVTSPEVDLEEVVAGYSRPLRQAGYAFEIVLVLDGVGPGLAEQSARLAEDYPVKTVILHGAGLGESVALTAGVDSAAADLIINAPQYLQTEPDDMLKVVKTLQSGADFVATWRYPRVDPWLNRLQSSVFNRVMGLLMGNEFHDLNSGMRGMRRTVLEEVNIYGDLYRFLPVLAKRQGFKVAEVKLRHREERGRTGFYGVGVYVRRLLDLLAISFLTRFRERPLRFFGMIGFACIILGLPMVAWPLWDKFTGAQGLQTRPIFVAGTILVTFGVQLIGFGLVGEIIIFTQARNMEEYQVEQVLSGRIEMPTQEQAIEEGTASTAALQVRELLPGEDARWDAFVREHERGTFFHLTGWRKCVEDTFRHESIYLVAERRGEWMGILPLFRTKSPFLGNNLISVPYAVYGGALVRDDQATRALLDAARAIGSHHKAQYVELRERHTLDLDLPVSDLYVTFRQDLPADPAKVMPAIPKKARAEVRRARDQFGLTCEVSDDLVSFYRLFVANKKRLGSPSLPFRWFKALRQEFGKKAVLHLVREPDGTPIAAVMSFLMNKVIYAYYSGSLFDRNKTGVNNMIYCAIMEWGAANGYAVFDFGRSRRDSGPASFKKNMGFIGEPLHYQYCMLSDSAKVPSFNPSNPKLDLPRRIWAHLPPMVARGLSGPLSRYLP